METFHSRILTWYDRHARVLPWRVSPADGMQGVLPDPYHVWLSEVMLQQTTVATVKSYFEKFLTLWPTIEDLAAAEPDDVMKAWAGLGYYSRARNLKACADKVAEEFGGKLPQTQHELIQLPGVGDYTSAAIAAIAFGERTRVVDGNIERVSTRHTANTKPLPAVKEDCRSFMDRHTPADRPGDFVQAMMDLGATICTPKTPACALCPVNADCAAQKAGTMLDYPVKAPKKQKPTRKGAAFVIQRPDGAVWLIKRPSKGLLGDMAAVPSTNWSASKDGATGMESFPIKSIWAQRSPIKHTFTHFHLELEVWHCLEAEVIDKGWWSPMNQLPTEALPTVMKKVISSALPDVFRPSREKHG